MQYSDGCKQPYTVYQIINNAYNVVLAKGLYTEPSNMWRKKLSSDKILADFNNFFTEDYHDLRKLQNISATQADFHGSNMATTIQDEISEALENMAMAATLENMYSPR